MLREQKLVDKHMTARGSRINKRVIASSMVFYFGHQEASSEGMCAAWVLRFK